MRYNLLAAKLLHVNIVSLPPAAAAAAWSARALSEHVAYLVLFFDAMSEVKRSIHIRYTTLLAYRCAD